MPEICQFDIQKEVEDVRTVVGVLAVALRRWLCLWLGFTLVCAVVAILSVATGGWWVGAWRMSVTVESVRSEVAHRSWRTCRSRRGQVRHRPQVEPQAEPRAEPLGWQQEQR